MTFPDDRIFFQYSLIAIYFLGLVTFIVGWFISPATNDRFYRPGSGPSLYPPVAWFLLTSPPVYLTLLLFPLGQHAANPKSWILLAPYLIHYLHRHFVYPLLLYRTKSAERFPISVFAIGICFNLLNVYLLTREISHYKDYDNDRWFWLRVFGGLFLFVWGMRLNIWADRILTGLKGQDGKYRIPEGGWFELISCPNYFGELVEWFAWSIMTGSVVILGFFFFSCANMIPRAHSNQKWYFTKFRDYPKTRKAVIPFIF